MSGLSLEEVAKLLGHTQVQTTARYAHLSDEHVQATANIVSERIAESLNKKPKKVEVSSGEHYPVRRLSQG